MGRERLERYSLLGPENQAAVEAGLAGGAWFRSAVPRKRMKELMRRSDDPAVRDTAIWIALILTFGGLGIAFWGTWWAVPFLLAYGILYGSTSDSRWHESGHGTAFKTRWIDEGLYQLASFMIMRDPTTWRCSHTRHHTDTLIVGRDPEIAVMRPARLAKLLANLIGLVDVPVAFGHRLPELHEEIKHDCAPVYPSLWAAYKEIIPAILRQLKDQEYYVRRELLPGAAPFNEPIPASDGRARPLAGLTAA